MRVICDQRTRGHFHLGAHHASAQHGYALTFVRSLGRKRKQELRMVGAKLIEHHGGRPNTYVKLINGEVLRLLTSPRQRI